MATIKDTFAGGALLNYDGPVMLTCSVCGGTRELAKRDRNRKDFPGIICDGPYYGARHRPVYMTGPNGDKRA